MHCKSNIQALKKSGIGRDTFKAESEPTHVAKATPNRVDTTKTQRVESYALQKTALQGGTSEGRYTEACHGCHICSEEEPEVEGDSEPASAECDRKWHVEMCCVRMPLIHHDRTAKKLWFLSKEEEPEIEADSHEAVAAQPSTRVATLYQSSGIPTPPSSPVNYPCGSCLEGHCDQRTSHSNSVAEGDPCSCCALIPGTDY